MYGCETGSSGAKARTDFQRLNGTSEEAAEKVVARGSGPQRLKAAMDLAALMARVKLVPFPKPASGEFSTASELVRFPKQLMRPALVLFG